MDVELSNIQSARNQVPSVNYETPGSCRPAPGSECLRHRGDREGVGPCGSRGASPTLHQTNGQGEYVSFKVPGRQVVYSLGWSPTRTAANAKERLLKAEYIFAPYRPGKALLTGGNIDFSGSIAINAVAGLPADVHTNANVTGSMAA